MRIIGEKIFAKDANGNLLSRIGTIFLRTPGLVTRRGIHAMQRIMWIEELAKTRPLTPEEEEAELMESVDLIFSEDMVLIRPNPDRMDLAFRADEELQKMVSKRSIRFLNTNSEKVRSALCKRGENWRMARQPISQEDMVEFIEKSKVAIDDKAIYYYNRTTGTRYFTISSYEEIKSSGREAFRRQMAELVFGLGKRNRVGYPEVDIFPLVTPAEIKGRMSKVVVDELDDDALELECERIVEGWRASIPEELRDEATKNFCWRNAMCEALTKGPNETSVKEQELIAGIAPEYYRQIEWLPGARIDNGEVIFDTIYEEASRTQDPELLMLCDNRVKSIIFNATRLFSSLEYINIGRISHSLSRRPVEGNRRGDVYIMQYRTIGSPTVKVQILRLQKWGVAERLDEGKELLQAYIESDEYSDYILDRRLMCRQLGMNLPKRVSYGHFTEKYRGRNEYNGCTVRTAYFMRAYVPGFATDKIPVEKYRQANFAVKFAEMMGRAAATDMIVGRRSSVTNEMLFDRNYEVLQLDKEGMPTELKITDHAGSFNDYETPYESYVSGYAEFVNRRIKYLTDVGSFASAYVLGFRKCLMETQESYRLHQRAFDELFADRPYDTNGSGAYRWACALRRLKACDPEKISAVLALAIKC